MGHELYRMIRDGAPPGWTGPMVHVAQAIADDARDPSQGEPEDGGWPWSAIPMRGCWRGGEWRDGITERTGMSERAVRRALEDLGKASYEMRERISTDGRGRPVFAYRGHAVRFRVPLLAPRKPPERRPGTATITGERSPGTATERQGERRPDPSERWPDPATKVAKDGRPISPDPPIVPPALNRSAVDGPVEGGGDGEIKTDFSDDDGKGTCPVCGQRAELMRTMAGPVIRNHSRGRDGEAHCPGTGQPPARAVSPP
jgi:hypothetical protein